MRHCSAVFAVRVSHVMNGANVDGDETGPSVDHAKLGLNMEIKFADASLTFL